MTDFHDMKTRRIPNWARWSWRELRSEWPLGYTLQCPGFVSLLHDGDEEGYGEYVEGNTALVPQKELAKAEYDPIDDDDAETVDVLVRQIEPAHRLLLIRTYVYKRGRPAWQDLDKAIAALVRLGDETKLVHARMRER